MVYLCGLIVNLTTEPINHQLIRFWNVLHISNCLSNAVKSNVLILLIDFKNGPIKIVFQFAFSPLNCIYSLRMRFVFIHFKKSEIYIHCLLRMSLIYLSQISFIVLCVIVTVYYNYRSLYFLKFVLIFLF